MRKRFLIMIGLGVIGLVVAGCENTIEPPKAANDTPEREMVSLEAEPPPAIQAAAPSPLVTVSVGDKGLRFWPFTGNNFSGNPQDPINLIFFGQADPRDIRAALLSLDGDRTAFGMPPTPPFNSTWDDAIGDVQTGYGEALGVTVALSSEPPYRGNHKNFKGQCNWGGWTGSSIQLACGNYDGLRFHLRLFKIGQWTIGNAHLDVLIPGTTDHQVLSWEVAEQFVIADFVRSGLLDQSAPVIPTDQINPSPFRTIPAVIYNGLPVELRALIGGPLGDVTEDVPIQSDGYAVILNIAGSVPRVVETRSQDFVLNFNQVIPKPFCSSGPTDYLYVNGPVHLEQTARLNSAGVYEVSFVASGELTVTPVDPLTGQPTGEPMAATVRERHSGMMNDTRFSASSAKYQVLGMPTDPGSGRLFVRLNVNSCGAHGYREIVRCGADEWRTREEGVRPPDLLTTANQRGSVELSQ